MFFRFCSALTLVVLIAITGISIEKQLLDLKREQTLQVYRLEQLEEKFTRLRLRSHELGAPARLISEMSLPQLDRASSIQGNRPPTSAAGAEPAPMSPTRFKERSPRPGR